MHFDEAFKHLTGHGPFPWQEKLFEEFLNRRFRKTCPIPTGLGKTSIIAIWILALAHHAHGGTLVGFPRRLVYVVNRRTVVDQSTEEARKMRTALTNRPELRDIAEVLKSLQTTNDLFPLAISTLRGQFADNAEWRNDPARPAVIIGTVDMIGSRLLFSGYGCGFRSKPLHAGFLGQDTLLVHDEAHLEPAFQRLIADIEKEQVRCCEFGKFLVMELTATSRTAAENEDPIFTEKDRNHPIAKARIYAKKGIEFYSTDDKRKLRDKVVKIAKEEYRDSGKAILIFLREVEDVKHVASELRKVVSEDHVQTLTGTMRGWERDNLANEDKVFARFVRKLNNAAQQVTDYLVCTSAGEVGVNISADHLICDLTPFDSMMQRFGRVNRFGDGDANIDIVHIKFDESVQSTENEEPVSDNTQMNADTTSSKKKSKQPSELDMACAKTLSLLKLLPERDGRHDASLDALAATLAVISDKDREAAFTPTPVVLPATEILFDTWALTSVRQKLTGRPPVVDWLHGVGGWEPPATYVAWREEVSLIGEKLLKKYMPDELLEDYPLKPHELLRDQTRRVFDELEKIAARYPEMPVWVIDSDGQVELYTIEKLVKRDRRDKPVLNLADCTVLLPPEAGGLNKSGMLDGNPDASNGRYDIADEWTDEKGSRRCRLWDDEKPPKGMRQIRLIDTKTDIDEEGDEEAETTSHRYWCWYARPRSADDDGSSTARVKQSLKKHLESAEDFAMELTGKLGLAGPEASAVVYAARLHDMGKDRQVWQRSIGNPDYPDEVLAKSGPGMRPIDISTYRHEFGSLIDIHARQDFNALAKETQDLVLHLVAAHHGRARPHFSEVEAFDPERPDDVSAEIAGEVPRRFALLQRKYGRWGLAYLESLVRAADILASQSIIGGGEE